jgi:hypothetical protein
LLLATINTSSGTEYAKAYDGYSGYSTQAVGLGTVPGMYASPSYAARKTDTLLIGIPSKIQYAAFDVDPTPMAVPIQYISQYNMLLSINLRYAPSKIRQQIMSYILQSNDARIRSNQSIIIDWHGLARAVPSVRYMTRNYKTPGIRVIESYNLADLPQVLNQRSPFESQFMKR